MILSFVSLDERIIKSEPGPERCTLQTGTVREEESDLEKANACISGWKRLIGPISMRR